MSDPCACRFDEDDEQVKWCSVHLNLRDRLAAVTRERDEARALAMTQEDELMKVWFVLKGFGLHPGRTDDRLSSVIWSSIDAIRAEVERLRKVISRVVDAADAAAGHGGISSEMAQLRLRIQDAREALTPAKERRFPFLTVIDPTMPPGQIELRQGNQVVRVTGLDAEGQK